MRLKIFISSVQSEFAEERRRLKDYIEHNPVLRRFFEVFIFEDVAPTDRRADDVYLEELAKSHVYLALIGAHYCGGENSEISPTEREYDEATRLGVRRIVLVDETNTGLCDPVNDPVNDLVNDDISQLVLSAIRNHPGIRRNVIAQIVGVSEATVKRRLKELSHFVKFRGAPKTSGYYVVAR